MMDWQLDATKRERESRKMEWGGRVLTVWGSSDLFSLAAGDAVYSHIAQAWALSRGIGKKKTPASQHRGHQGTVISRFNASISLVSIESCSTVSTNIATTHSLDAAQL
jgi:hypothetical protein